MTRFVVDPGVALQLAAGDVRVHEQHVLLAPTLLRSQVLTQLYAAVRRGELGEQDATERLDRVRALRVRLLGDRVLQRTAWQLAAQLGWPGTEQAEYVALVRLQADALVTLDDDLARAVDGVVVVAPFEALLSAPGR